MRLEKTKGLFLRCIPLIMLPVLFRGFCHTFSFFSSLSHTHTLFCHNLPLIPHVACNLLYGFPNLCPTTRQSLLLHFFRSSSLFFFFFFFQFSQCLVGIIGYFRWLSRCSKKSELLRQRFYQFTFEQMEFAGWIFW